MLFNSTIHPGALVLLKQLMKIPELNDFSLVGGTALALRYGHRTSVDLDLFSAKEFQNADIIKVIENYFPSFEYKNPYNPIGVFGYIDDVKVDFVKHHYHKLIDKVVTEDDIRIVSDKDIIAMKVNAVLKRAVKKDFWDIAELLRHYTVEDFIDFYFEKFPSQMLLIPIPRALTFFDDAEESDEPVSLKGQAWGKVKKFIQKKVSDYLR